MLPPADDLVPSKSNVVVIGKFQLDPPLDPQLEQRTHAMVIGDGGILNRVIMATGSLAEPVSTQPVKTSDWQSAIKAQWGVPFMVEAARGRTWLRGAMTQLNVSNQERLWFPGGVYFDVPAGAKAVYIGTLKYTRDDFNTIVGMRVIDEFDATVSELNLVGRQNQIVSSLLKGPDRGQMPRLKPCPVQPCSTASAAGLLN